MDIRIKRTKELINGAILELLKEKPIEKITPTELCRKATINRNTFYSHYKNTSEVLEEIENNLLAKVNEYINASKSPVEAITILCRMLKENQPLSSLLFSKNFSSKVMKEVFNITNKYNMTKMNNEDNTLTDSYKQMLSNYTIMGSTAVLEYWVKNGMKEDPSDIAEFIYTVSKKGSSAISK